MSKPIKPPTLGSTISRSPSQPKDISKLGKQGLSAKMPKSKAAPSAFSPPSVFYKSEDTEPKHHNLLKLHNFINKKHRNKSQK